MKSLIDYSLNEEYEKVERLGDRLAEVDSLIDWEAFRPIVAGMYRNNTKKGGRPNIGEVVMIKILGFAAVARPFRCMRHALWGLHPLYPASSLRLDWSD